MYEAYFGFRLRPFSILPDPRFLYYSRNHRFAYAMLEYGIVSQAGFTVITGAIGSGKTTLIRQLIANLGRDVSLGLISNTSETGGGLLEWIMMSFGQPYEGRSYPALYDGLQKFLRSEYEQGRRAVLVIDEAQNLDARRLEELRMLSNVNVDRMLLQLILAGQPELRDMLNAPELTQFAQRISSDFHLPPLRKQDAVSYIDHRVTIAGGSPDIFSRPAKLMIFEAAQGIPRSINILADKCLVYAFGDGVKSVSRRLVARVMADGTIYGLKAVPLAETPA